jgi:CRISPR-associated protein Csx3
MSVFQRAEASTFWGREIGLMYMHAHLRYAEALARFGDAERLFSALCQANPIGVTERVPRARARQSTTYYSSSDGAFDDRLDASERYAALMAGDVDLEGGWRVYSSGPGLYLRLLAETLLGVRSRGPRVELDPVLAPTPEGIKLADILLDLASEGDRGTFSRPLLESLTRYTLGDRIAEWLHIPRHPGQDAGPGRPPV